MKKKIHNLYDFNYNIKCNRRNTITYQITIVKRGFQIL